MIVSRLDKEISIEYSFVDYNVPRWSHRFEYQPGIAFKSREQGKPDISGYFDLIEEEFTGGYTGEGIRYQQGKEVDKYFLTTDRLSLQAITQLWNQIVLTPKEEMVTETLRILEPDLQRIALTNQTTPEMSIRLKIKGYDKPVPLGRMGDGIYRIFALTLLLVSCENGALFVDEIDTGLHYTALTKMWYLVIKTAKKLNVQVFATTHSWDCLASFQTALEESSASELGTVFRLERKNEQIDSVAYTGNELAVAVAHDIEVR